MTEGHGPGPWSDALLRAAAHPSARRQASLAGDTRRRAGGCWESDETHSLPSRRKKTNRARLDVLAVCCMLHVVIMVHWSGQRSHILIFLTLFSTLQSPLVQPHTIFSPTVSFLLNRCLAGLSTHVEEDNNNNNDDDEGVLL